MSFRVIYGFEDVQRDTSGWLFGIPNPFPFDIFSRGGIFGYDPFPSGPSFPEPVPAPQLPVVIGERPSSIEELEREREALEAIIREEPFIPSGTVVLEPLDPSVVIGEVHGGDTVEQDDLGDDDVAHDWGHLIRQGIQEVTGIGQPQVFEPTGFVPEQPGVTTGAVVAHNGGGDHNGCDGMTWAGGAPPKGYKVVRDSCGNGVLRKVRRRRRRRMLTNSDKDDIASVVSMVGKGALAASLINGSMRRG